MDSYWPLGVYHMISALSELRLQTFTFWMSAGAGGLTRVVNVNGVVVLSTSHLVAYASLRMLIAMTLK